MYHEIVSIPVTKGLSIERQKDALLDATHRYLDQRAPNNIVYGRMHLDHLERDLHMHLVISSNPHRSEKRLSLSQKRYAEIQRDTELYFLKAYPEIDDQARQKGNKQHSLKLTLERLLKLSRTPQQLAQGLREANIEVWKR